MEKAIIAAVADNGAIGKDNALLWHISEDLKYFKKVTSGHPVIMGRKTFASIGRPLPKRLNIIVSRNLAASGANPCGEGPMPDNVLVAASLEEAFLLAGPDTPGREKAATDKCFVIGGGEIYRQALPLADTMYITHVHTEIKDADTFFPEISASDWTMASNSERFTDPETGYEFEFSVYRKSRG
ncbi:MAG: dihydrofolate reductase [Bacteroidetes bacterium]|uniref:Dihydrofolate reductase n=1 Tax=Candidatus Cryptobacteroides merdavium TaxID=2840769 RepID=A0A9D9EDK1_9BACT|nr:dihydrofolate reductase [Candidatus Cryptobacteroides merdavium]